MMKIVFMLNMNLPKKYKVSPLLKLLKLKCELEKVKMKNLLF